MNYDGVAGVYDKRYETDHYAGIQVVLDRFIGGDSDLAVVKPAAAPAIGSPICTDGRES